MPTVAIYIAALVLLTVYLSNRVATIRRKHMCGVGDGGHNELSVAIRAQANLVEYAPLMSILLICLELGNANMYLLHGLAGGFLLARIAHAWGFIASEGKTSKGRFYGTAGTWIIMAATSLSVVFYSIF